MVVKLAMNVDSDLDKFFLSMMAKKLGLGLRFICLFALSMSLQSSPAHAGMRDLFGRMKSWFSNTPKHRVLEKELMKYGSLLTSNEAKNADVWIKAAQKAFPGEPIPVLAYYHSHDVWREAVVERPWLDFRNERNLHFQDLDYDPPTAIFPTSLGKMRRKFVKRFHDVDRQAGQIKQSRNWMRVFYREGSYEEAEQALNQLHYLSDFGSPGRVKRFSARYNTSHWADAAEAIREHYEYVLKLTRARPDYLERYAFEKRKNVQKLLDFYERLLAD